MLKWISWVQPLLPICLIAGRAAQAFGFYLFGLLIPALMNQSSLTRRASLRTGIGLLALYFIFPLIDVVQLFVHAPSELIDWSPVDLTRSQFSSSVGLTGLFFCLYSWMLPRIEVSFEEDRDTIDSFTMGFFVGGILLSAYALVQLTTGFNFTEIADARADRIMAFGLYRVPGFTGHPVHFAGQCLPVFAFFWTRSWVATPRLGFKEISITGMFLVLVWVSGSRMGALSAMVLLVLIPWVHGGLSWRWKAALIGVALCSGVLLTVVTGMSSRLVETLGSGQYSGLGDRAYFWQVHWAMFLESPWIGYGHFWTEEYWRPQFYTKLGLGDFRYQYNAHNVYLEILADCGILGAGAIGCALTLLIVTLRRLLARTLGVAMLWAIVSLALFGMTQNSLFDTPAQITLLGLGVICIWSQRPDLAKSQDLPIR